MARRSEGKATLASEINECRNLILEGESDRCSKLQQSSGLEARTSDNNLNEEILFQSTAWKKMANHTVITLSIIVILHTQEALGWKILLLFMRNMKSYSLRSSGIQYPLALFCAFERLWPNVCEVNVISGKVSKQNTRFITSRQTLAMTM